MKKVQKITRAWFIEVWRKKIRKPKAEIIPMAQILNNAIKLQAHSLGGGRIRYS